MRYNLHPFYSRGAAVSDRWALLVAIDSYQDACLGAVPYAEAGAKAAADALVVAGYPKKNQFLLLGSHATQGAILSRVRKLKRLMKKGDELLVWLDAHGFSFKGDGVLAVWDTLPDDLVESGVSVGGLVKDLTASKAAQVVFLLDVGAGPKPSTAYPEAVAPHLDFEQLSRLFDESPKAVCLTATVDDEESLMAAQLKASVWSHLVLEALGGRAAKAVTAAGMITAASLQRFIDDELPRVVRKHFTGAPPQSPRLFGEQNAAALVADLSPLLAQRTGGGLLDPARLKRIVFRTESRGRVKDLNGFRKTFRLPDSAGPSTRKFIAKCAAADVRADVDAVFEVVRERFGYKRRDVDTTAGQDGFGSVRTPDFEYTVSVAQDPANPTDVIWRREVGQVADAGVVRGAAFEGAFGKLFDQLAFEFAVPVEVGDLVDRLEDTPATGRKVSVESDGSACEITLAGFAGAVRVERGALTIRGRSGTSGGLLDQFLAFVSSVGPLGEPLALPPR
jgi:hypothetical protein